MGRYIEVDKLIKMLDDECLKSEARCQDREVPSPNPNGWIALAYLPTRKRITDLAEKEKDKVLLRDIALLLFNTECVQLMSESEGCYECEAWDIPDKCLDRVVTGIQAGYGEGAFDGNDNSLVIYLE